MLAGRSRIEVKKNRKQFPIGINWAHKRARRAFLISPKALQEVDSTRQFILPIHPLKQYSTLLWHNSLSALPPSGSEVNCAERFPRRCPHMKAFNI